MNLTVVGDGYFESPMGTHLHKLLILMALKATVILTCYFKLLAKPALLRSNPNRTHFRDVIQSRECIAPHNLSGRVSPFLLFCPLFFLFGPLLLLLLFYFLSMTNGNFTRSFSSSGHQVLLHSVPQRHRQVSLLSEHWLARALHKLGSGAFNHNSNNRLLPLVRLVAAHSESRLFIE